MNLSKIFFLVVTFGLFVLVSSCKETPTKPEDELPEKEVIVPQINIPWSSLADTPWPMYHHDPQSTGRSEYVGPQQGAISSVQFAEFGTMSGISIGYNKTAFLPSGDFSYRFVAFDYSGNVKWSNDFSSTSTPIISSDSSIYISTVNNTFLSLNRNGDTLWQTSIGKMYNIGCNIDKEGNICFIDFHGSYIAELKVIDKNGKILWTLQDGRFLPSPDSQPSFSPDGNTLYVQGEKVSVLAIDINSKNVKWTFGDRELLSSPVIDNDGNIFIIIRTNSLGVTLYSINSDGEINWQFDFFSRVLMDNVEPTIDYNGNIYFGGDTLYSVTNNGKLRWAKSLDEGAIVAPIICDKNNDIYVATNRIQKIFSFTSDGKLKWKTAELPFRTLGACPAITDEGTLLFPSWRNYQISLSIIR